MSFIPNSPVKDIEKLYRTFPENPNFWNKKEKRFSSALFKTKNGVSVDREGDRPQSEVIKNFQNRMPGKYVGFLVTGEIRKAGGDAVPDPLPDNIYHAHITSSSGELNISKPIQRELARLFQALTKPLSFE